MMGNSLPSWLQRKQPQHVQSMLAGQITALRAGPEGMAERGRLGGFATNASKSPEERRAIMAKVRSRRVLTSWHARGITVSAVPEMTYNQFMLLRGLAVGGPSFARPLFRSMGLFEGAANNVAAWLRVRGYVESADGRPPYGCKRTITEAGRAALARVEGLLNGAGHG